MEEFSVCFNYSHHNHTTELHTVRKLIVISCSISFGSLLLVLLPFSIIGELRRSAYGKYWIMCSITACIHHTAFLGMRGLCIRNPHLFHEILDKCYQIVFIIYFSLEFSLYMWLNVICFDIFVSLKSLRLSNPPWSRRFSAQIFVCYIVPIAIVVLMLLLMNKTTMINVFIDKLLPSSTLSTLSEKTLITYGCAEISLRILRLSFFIGVCFVIWKNNRNLRTLGVTINRSTVHLCDRIRSCIQMITLFHLIVGLLVINVLTITIGVFNHYHPHKGENRFTYWSTILNPFEEFLKFLYGFYILVFIVCGKEFTNSVLKWIVSKCNRRPNVNRNMNENTPLIGKPTELLSANRRQLNV